MPALALYNEDTTVPVIYDPQNPANCTILWAEPTGAEPETTGSWINWAESIEKPLLACVWAGALLLIALACRAVGGEDFNVKGYSLPIVLGSLLVVALVKLALEMRAGDAIRATNTRLFGIIAAALFLGVIGSSLWIRSSDQAEVERQAQQDAERAKYGDADRAGRAALQKYEDARQRTGR